MKDKKIRVSHGAGWRDAEDVSPTLRIRPKAFRSGIIPGCCFMSKFDTKHVAYIFDWGGAGGLICRVRHVNQWMFNKDPRSKDVYRNPDYIIKLGTKIWNTKFLFAPKLGMNFLWDRMKKAWNNKPFSPTNRNCLDFCLYFIKIHMKRIGNQDIIKYYLT